MERIVLTTDGKYIMSLSEMDKVRYENWILTEGRQTAETLIDSVIEKNKETQWLDLTDFERWVVIHASSLLAIHWQQLGTIYGILTENIMWRVFVLNNQIEEVVLIEKRANHILIKSKNETMTSQYIRKYPNDPFRFESVIGPDCVFAKREDAKKHLVDYWEGKEKLGKEGLVAVQKMLEAANKL